MVRLLGIHTLENYQKRLVAEQKENNSSCGRSPKKLDERGYGAGRDAGRIGLDCLVIGNWV
jgi:hypothetical protein